MIDYAVGITLLSLSFYLLYQILVNAKLRRYNQFLSDSLELEHKTSKSLRELLKEERLK